MWFTGRQVYRNKGKDSGTETTSKCSHLFSISPLLSPKTQKLQLKLTESRRTYKAITEQSQPNSNCKWHSCDSHCFEHQTFLPRKLIFFLFPEIYLLSLLPGAVSNSFRINHLPFCCDALKDVGTPVQGFNESTVTRQMCKDPQFKLTIISSQDKTTWSQQIRTSHYFIYYSNNIPTTQLSISWETEGLNCIFLTVDIIYVRVGTCY